MPRPKSPGEITGLLRDLEKGDSTALDKLAPIIYGDLREMAARIFRNERPGHTLQPTELVHEVYLRLMGPKKPPMKNRGHFFAIASRSMRQILVSHARKHRATKRGGGQEKVELDEGLAYSKERSDELLALDQALTQLASLDPRQAQIVELRYFAGLSVDETAKLLRLGRTTVIHEWSLAKAWVRRELENSA